MNITVRKCMISDAANVRKLSRQALGFEYPEDKFEENIRRLMATQSNCIYVAENGNTSAMSAILTSSTDRSCPCCAPSPLWRNTAVTVLHRS